jgi:hypothetical protein
VRYKHDIELLRHDLKETELRLTGDLTLVKWMLGLIIVAEIAPWLVKFFSGAID